MYKKETKKMTMQDRDASLLNMYGGNMRRPI